MVVFFYEGFWYFYEEVIGFWIGFFYLFKEEERWVEWGVYCVFEFFFVCVNIGMWGLCKVCKIEGKLNKNKM